MDLYFKKIGIGKPMVMLHGLFGSGDNMLSLARYFSTEYEVFLPDLRNHGHSPHSDMMNYYAMCDDILNFFTEHRIGPAVLIGHSMGGKVAMQFASENGSLVENLIVADIGIKKYPLRHIPYIEALLTTDFDKLVSREEVALHFRQNIENEGVVQLLLKNLEWKNNKRLGWRLNADALYSNIDNILDAVSFENTFDKDTLFLKGELSDYILKGDTESIKKYFPRMQMALVKGASHWLHADNFDGVTDAIDRFLK